MANRLEKTTQVIGGAGVPGGGDFVDVGGEPADVGLPPVGSRCYEDLFVKVAQLWPNHIITHVKPDSGADYFRVSDFSFGYVWRVTGTCQNGYIKINYTLLQSPGIGSA